MDEQERRQAIKDSMSGLSERERDAAIILLDFGTEDGAHHKMWAIDQALRILAGSSYDKLIAAFKDGEDGPETYGYDEGIAP